MLLFAFASAIRVIVNIIKLIISDITISKVSGINKTEIVSTNITIHESTIAIRLAFRLNIPISKKNIVQIHNTSTKSRRSLVRRTFSGKKAKTKMIHKIQQAPTKLPVANP